MLTDTFQVRCPLPGMDGLIARKGGKLSGERTRIETLLVQGSCSGGEILSLSALAPALRVSRRERVEARLSEIDHSPISQHISYYIDLIVTGVLNWCPLHHEMSCVAELWICEHRELSLLWPNCGGDSARIMIGYCYPCIV